MKITRKTDIIAVTVFVCFICAVLIWQNHKVKRGQEDIIYRVFSCIKLYLIHSNGTFPTSEDDLIKKGCIKKSFEKGKGVYAYSIRYYLDEVYEKLYPENIYTVKMETWDNSVRFNEFKIYYRAKLETLEIINNKLYDKTTHKPVLLIESPYEGKALREISEKISLELYQEMLRLQKEHSEIGPTEINIPKVYCFRLSFPVFKRLEYESFQPAVSVIPANISSVF